MQAHNIYRAELILLSKSLRGGKITRKASGNRSLTVHSATSHGKLPTYRSRSTIVPEMTNHHGQLNSHPYSFYDSY